MSRGRLAVIGVALGLIASQAGHVLAYEIRYGAMAEHLQSSGAHAYFPALVKTGVGLAAAFVLLALIAIGSARVVSGRKLVSTPAPSFLRLVAMLFCLQLTCFMVQETVEMAAGAPAASAPALLLWGTAGQLPVALVAALALRWLAVRLGPAIERLLAPVRPALRLTLCQFRSRCGRQPLSRSPPSISPRISTAEDLLSRRDPSFVSPRRDK